MLGRGCGWYIKRGEYRSKWQRPLGLPAAAATRLEVQVDPVSQVVQLQALQQQQQQLQLGISFAGPSTAQPLHDLDLAVSLHALQQ